MSFLSLTTINDHEVIPFSHGPKCKKFLGQEIIGKYLSHRILICGPSGKGKTVLAMTLIKALRGRHTELYIFSPTAMEDPEVLPYIKSLGKKMIEKTFIYPSTMEGGVDILNPIFHSHNVVAKEKEEGKQGGYVKIEVEESDDEKEEKQDENDWSIPWCEKRKGEMVLVPHSIMFVDDNPAELHYSSNVEMAFKTVRHFWSMIIAVIHDMKDLRKGIRQEVTIACLFSGIPWERYRDFLIDWGFASDMEEIKELFRIYQMIAKGNDFLYMNKTNKEMRRNLNQKISLKSALFNQT